MTGERPVEMGPADLEFRRQVGEHEARILKIEHALPERLALLGEGHRLVECALGDCLRRDGDRQPLLRQLAHQVTKPAAFGAKATGDGHTSAYEDPDVYWAVSAIRTIKKAKTPTLIYVGERDIEVPPTQSVEYWHALKAMNVPTSLVIYPDEGHGIRLPAHTQDLERRTLAWFGRYLGTAAP